MNFVPIVFFETDPIVIANRIIARFEAKAGRKVHPSDIEADIFHSCADEISNMAIAGNEAANQMFIANAKAPILDYLAYNKGVERLPPVAALCTIRFLLVPGHGNVTIPLGTRISSTDGQAVFETIDSEIIAPEVNSIDIKCQAIAEGSLYNDYIIGSISKLLDPLPFVSSVSNLGVTSAGSDQESDERLRERAFLSSNSPSTAGSVRGYKFHALGAHPSIIDVAIPEIPTVAGIVKIYPLVEGGIETPEEIITLVEEACNSAEVRPTTDTVEVLTPTPITFSLSIGLTVLKGGIDAIILAEAEKALGEYLLESQKKLGRDIVVTKIIQLCQVQNVYEVDTGLFTSNLIVGPTEFPVCPVGDWEIVITDRVDG